MKDLLEQSIVCGFIDDVLTHLFTRIDLSYYWDSNYCVAHIVSWINQELSRNGIGLRDEGSTIRIYFTESSLFSVKPNKVFDMAHIRGLADRCESDLMTGNYDGIITKTRTMMEETFLHILKQHNIHKNFKGNMMGMFQEVRAYCNMDGENIPHAVRDITTNLNKIVELIGYIRNNYSDAHAAGQDRVTLTDAEARLVVNSAMTLMEYVLSVSESGSLSSRTYRVQKTTQT